MKRTGNRILALVMAVVMATGILPFNAYADEIRNSSGRKLTLNSPVAKSEGVWDLAESSNTQYLHVSSEATTSEQERDAAFKVRFIYSLNEDIVRAIDSYDGNPVLVYDLNSVVADSPLGGIRNNTNGSITIGSRKLGRYTIIDNVVTMTFTDTDYFNGKTSFVGFFDATLETSITELENNDEYTYTFPGTKDTIPVKYKKTVEDGTKSVYSTQDENGDTILHYTANISVNNDLDSLEFNDVISGLQTLDSNSVKVNGKGASVTVSGSGFSFKVEDALGTTGVSKGSYQVTYDTRVTAEQLQSMTANTTKEDNKASWKVNGTKDVPGGETRIEIDKPKEPIPVKKQINNGTDAKEPGDEIEYSVSYGSDTTVLAGFTIADYFTDVQVLQGDISISYGDTTIKLPETAIDSAATDNHYSTGMTTLFEYIFPDTTVGNGPVTVTYRTKLIDQETAKKNGIFDTIQVSNTAEEKRQNTKDTVTTAVKYEKEPVYSVQKTVAANNDGETWSPEEEITYTLTIGDSNTEMAGVEIRDVMTDLQILSGDVMIQIGSGTAMRLNDYVPGALTYTDDQNYSSNDVELFHFNMPNDAGVGPVIITYTTKIISQDQAEKSGIYGNVQIRNTGYGGQQSAGTQGQGEFAGYPINKSVANLNNEDINHQTVEMGNTIHYVLTFGKSGMDMSNVTIYDEFTDIQKLTGSVTIKKNDGSSFTMPAGSGQWNDDGVVWMYFDDDRYSNENVRVFNYRLPNDIGVGPITVEYDAQIISEDEAKESGISDTQNAYNTFRINNYQAQTDVKIEFPKEQKHNPQVKKEFDHWDVPNSKVYWNIIVEKDAESSYPLENVTVQEAWMYGKVSINEGNQGYYGYNQFNGSNFDVLNAVVMTDDGTVLTPGKDYLVDKSSSKFSFPILRERVHINLAFLSPAKIIDGYYMRNEVILNEKDSGIAEQTYHKPDIEAVKNGKYDETRKIITWEVQINPTAKQFTISDENKYTVLFKDNIPNGLTLLNYANESETNPTVFVKFGWREYEVSVQPTALGDGGSAIECNVHPKGRMEYNWDESLSGNKVVVTYKTKLSDEEWNQITSSLSGEKEFTNHATITAGDDESFEATDTVTVTSEGFITKTDSTKENGGVVIDEDGSNSKIITYRIDINPNSYVLNNGNTLTLTDYLDTNMDIDTESVTLKDETGSDISNTIISYNDDSRLFTIRGIPDQKHLILTYSCIARAQGTDTFKNTATLIGGGSHSANTSEEHKIYTDEAGVAVDGLMINLHKIDENGLKALEGAEFQLYECELAIGDLTNKEKYSADWWNNFLNHYEQEQYDVENSFKITKYKPLDSVKQSGSNGYIDWSSLSENKLYAWKEIKAPDGYIGNSEYHYFVLYQHIDVNTEDPTQNKPLPETEQTNRKNAAWALDDACQIANGIRVASLANFSTWTATNIENQYTYINATKMWEGDSDNLYETRPKDGIVLQLWAIHSDGSRERKDSPVAINVDQNGNWPSYIWNRLPAFDKEGNPIKYTVIENPVENYSTTYSDRGKGQTSGTITVTNKMIPKSTDLYVRKEFAPANADKPSQIIVNLLVIKTDKQGNSLPAEEAGIQGMLSSSNNWTYHFEKLPTKEVVNGIPYTLSYTVVEDPASANHYDLVEYSDGGRGVIEATEEDPLIITNKIITSGDLVLKKKLKNGSSDNVFEFEISFSGEKANELANEYSIVITDDAGGEPEFGSVPVENKTAVIRIKAGQTITIKDLPLGLQYRVSEKTISGYKVVSSSGITGQIQKGIVSEVEYTNEKVSDIQVTKAFDGISNLPAGFKITNNYNNSVFTVENAAGTNPYIWGIRDIPVGTEITFTESGMTAEGYDLTVNGTAITEENATIEVKATAETGKVNSASFINAYKQLPGTLKVTKNVKVNEADPTAQNKKVADGIYKFNVYATNADGEKTGNVLEVISVEIKDGVSKTVESVKKYTAGRYVVEEDSSAMPDHVGLLQSSNTTVTVSAGKTGDAVEPTGIASFTNNIDVGSLEIKKKVTVNGGSTEGTLADGTYTFAVTGPGGYSDSVDLTISNGTSTSKTLINLIPGEYTITEMDPGNGTQVVGNGSQKVTVSGGKNATKPAEASFTNNVDVGSLKIKKNVQLNGNETDTTEADGTYTFTVTDADGKTTTHTITIENGVSKEITIGNLKPGTYTVAEDTSKNPEGMAVVGAASQEVTVSAGTGSQVETAEFTNNKTSVGALKITKNVTVNGAAVTNATKNLADGVYQFTVQGMGNNAGYQSTVVIRITDGESNTATVSNLIPGNYTITEITPTNGTSLTGNQNPVTVTVAPGTTEYTTEAIASFTNNIDVGGLKIQKALTENGKETLSDHTKSKLAGTYSFAIYTDAGCSQTLKDATGQDYRIQLTVGDDGKAVTSDEIINLPAGDYWIKETDPQNGSVATENPVKVTVAARKTGDQAVIATITNNYLVGDLEIQKKVTGNAGNKQQYFSFKVTLDDINIQGTYGDLIFTDGVAEFNLKDGEIKKASGLPAGTKYKVTETANNNYTTTSTGTDGTIPAGQKAQAVVTNKREAFGNLTISKKVRGNAVNQNTFEFTVTLKNADGQPVTGTIGTHTFNENGQTTVSIKANESLTIQHIPNGTSYTVTEKDEGFIVTGKAGNETEERTLADRTLNGKFDINSSVSYEKQGDQTVSFTNERNTYGGLKVSKVVIGTGSVQSFKFTVTLKDASINGTYGQMTFKDGVATFNLGENESKYALGLPNGLAYTVTEQSYAPNGYTTAMNGCENASVEGVVTEAAQMTEDRIHANNIVVVTNTVHAGDDLVISKTVTGNSGDKNKPFSFKVTLLHAQAALTDNFNGTLDGAEHTFTFTSGICENIQLKDGQTAVIKGLPAGTEYTVTETKEEGYIIKDADGQVIESASMNGKTNKKGEGASVTAFVNEKNLYGGLRIIKATGGNDGDKKSWFAFQVVLDDKTINGSYGDVVFVNGVSDHNTESSKEKLAAAGVAENLYLNKYPEANRPVNDKGQTSGESSDTSGWVIASTNCPIVITGLPAGIRYEVTEDTYASQRYQQSGIRMTGTINGLSNTPEGVTEAAIPTANTAEATNIRNSYNNLTLHKLISEDSSFVDNDREFEFAIELKDEKGAPVTGTYGDVEFNAGKATVKLKNGDSVIASQIPIKYEYDVHEILPTGYAVTYTHTDKNGSLEGATPNGVVGKIANNGHVVEATNTYSSEGTGSISVTKLIAWQDGKDYVWSDQDQYTFTLTGLDHAPMPSETSITITKEDPEHTKSFGEIRFTKAGIYQYRVKETKGTVGGITYDEAEHPVTIEVTDDRKGRLIASGASNLNQTVTVKNTYGVSGKGEIKVQKRLDGREWVNSDQFTFEIQGSAGAPMPAQRTIAIRKSDVNHTVSFGEIAFNKAGTYTYLIKETQGDIPGIEYDSVSHVVTIKVIEDSANHGSLIADTGSSLIQTVQSINTYRATGEGEIQVQKELNGRDWMDSDEFTFTLNAVGEAPLPVNTSITLNSSSENHIQSFDRIPFTKAGTYTYTVTESKGSANHIGYDPTVQQVVFTVVDDGMGHLSASANSKLVQKVQFTNQYTPDIPKFNKKILDINDTTDAAFDYNHPEKYTGWQDSADYDIGDAVPYRLQAVLPDDVTSYYTYHLTFHDKLEDTLSFNDDIRIIVMDQNHQVLSEPGFTKSTDHKTDSDTFAVTLSWGNGTERITDTRLNNAIIEVYFSAKLLENANLGKRGNVNEAYLEFSNQPSLKDGGQIGTNQTGKTEHDSVIAFTYKVEISKVNEENEALTGAEFTLEKKIKDQAVNEVIGEKIGTVTCTDDATFVFTGLDDGDYILKETKTPNGYKPIDPIEFTVAAAHKDEWVLPYDTAKDPSKKAIEREDILTNLTGEKTTGELVITSTDREQGLISGSVTNEMIRTSAEILKVWNDNNDEEHLRPLSVNVSLMQTVHGVTSAVTDPSGQAVTFTLSNTNQWKARIDNLPAASGSDTITYTWKEQEVSGYTAETVKPQPDGTLTVLINTRTPERVNIPVRKVWADNANQARPEAVTVQLFANGIARGEAIRLNAANNWQSAWTGLPKAEGGAAIRYTVEEIDVPEGYEAAVSGNAETGFTVTNTLQRGGIRIEKEFKLEIPEIRPEEEPEYREITVSKVWADNSNRDGNRPDSVTVRLYAGGTEVATAQITEAEGWQHTFYGLPARADNGRRIHYSVSEDAVPLYVSAVNGFTITNTYRPETTAAAVTKIWNDRGNEMNLRPESVRVSLSNGQETVAHAVLSEENGWSAAVSGLPTIVNGLEAEYTWTEEPVIGYDQESVTQQGSRTIITNKVWEREAIPENMKPKRTPGNTFYIFEDYDTPLGVEIMINHVGDCFD